MSGDGTLVARVSAPKAIAMVIDREPSPYFWLINVHDVSARIAGIGIAAPSRVIT